MLFLIESSFSSLPALPSFHARLPGAVVGQAAPVSEEGEVLQFCNTTAPPLLASTSSKQDLIGPLLHVAISTSIVGYHSFGWADSGRPTLLLIHGFGQSLDMWDVRLLEPLAREQRVIIFDTRGVGATEASGGLWGD